MNENERHYRIHCLKCGKEFSDSDRGFLLTCDQEHEPSLLRAIYTDKQLSIKDKQPGIFRYSGWLPIRRVLEAAHQPVVFQSRQLASHLGLKNLFLAFSGYWPEKGGELETCSFKELEALPVCARIPEEERRTMVVSSAGNTGRAFLQIASLAGAPVMVVIPEFALDEMWITTEPHPSVSLAVLRGPADYLDAIRLGNLIAAQEGFYPEGGAKNVARRDGMGTVVLAAIEAIGEIPAHYFQSVGSGTGGIAAWEMSLRLLQDGRFGNHRMKLHLIQNDPFAIMADAWQKSERNLPSLPEEEAKQRIDLMHAVVLSNRHPPYSVIGGVYDALCDTDGDMLKVGNREAEQAGRLFEELEGCDLDPAAEVALAGLIRAVELGRVRKEELVLLNLTGGGNKKIFQENRQRYLQPCLEFYLDEVTEEAVAKKIGVYLSRSEIALQEEMV